MEKNIRADAGEFKQRKDENPLGDREDIYEVGRFIIEIYKSDLMRDRGDYIGRLVVSEKLENGEYTIHGNKRYETFESAQNAAVELVSSEERTEQFVEGQLDTISD